MRWITYAIVLGTAYLISLDKLLASATASWRSWTVVWLARADLVVFSTAYMIVSVLVNGDWFIFDVVDLAVNKVLAIASSSGSAVGWVAFANEFAATLFFNGPFLSNNGWVVALIENGSFLARNTIGGLEALKSNFALIWITYAFSASAHGIAVALFPLPRSAVKWRFMVEWTTCFVSTVTRSHWAAHIHITLLVAESLNLAKTAHLTENAVVAVFSNVSTAGHAFTPGLLAAAVGGHGTS